MFRCPVFMNVKNLVIFLQPLYFVLLDIQLDVFVLPVHFHVDCEWRKLLFALTMKTFSSHNTKNAFLEPPLSLLSSYIVHCQFDCKKDSDSINNTHLGSVCILLICNKIKDVIIAHRVRNHFKQLHATKHHLKFF